MDSHRWPRCERFDGKTQPCLCWFSDRQRELVDVGAWPDSDVGMLADYLEMAQHHDCNKPIDWSLI